MTIKQGRYQSYLLRLWRTQSDEQILWRASLESPGTGERHGFADLQELFHFLQTQTEQAGTEEK
ncbi:MAG: hypothetical protein JXA37_08765 [Chloroflexia bacterium]|nr:hypothetical protein [Chloroflexia bacterium]